MPWPRRTGSRTRAAPGSPVLAGSRGGLAGPAIRVTDARDVSGSGSWLRAGGRAGRAGVGLTCARRWFPGVAVSGAWLSAALGARAGHLMQATDQVGRQLADLQLTLGEGPI